MLERATTRALPLLGRVAEAAPVTTGCCNACRTCVTTNIVGLVAVVMSAVASPFVRFASRFVRQ